jgi:hypothetical protein
MDAMHQTTLMQCYNPPHLEEGPTKLPDDYRTIIIDGTKYLLNDTMNHLMIVPTVTASETAQSILPVNLSKNSFAVMPSVIKKRKKRESSSSVVLAKYECSDSCCSTSNNSSTVYIPAK